MGQAKVRLDAIKRAEPAGEVTAVSRSEFDMCISLLLAPVTNFSARESGELSSLDPPQAPHAVKDPYVNSNSV